MSGSEQMKRNLTVLGALAIWAVGSLVLFGVCALSVNQAVMSAATFVTLACLVALIVVLSTGRERWLFTVAAGPAYAAGGLLALAVLYNLFGAAFN